MNVSIPSWKIKFMSYFTHPWSKCQQKTPLGLNIKLLHRLVSSLITMIDYYYVLVCIIQYTVYVGWQCYSLLIMWPLGDRHSAQIVSQRWKKNFQDFFSQEWLTQNMLECVICSLVLIGKLLTRLTCPTLVFVALFSNMAIKIRSGSKLLFWGGPTFFVPSDLFMCLLQ